MLKEILFCAIPWQVVNLLKAYMRRAGDADACHELDELVDQMAGSLNLEDMTEMLQKFADMAVGKLKQD